MRVWNTLDRRVQRLGRDPEDIALADHRLIGHMHLHFSGVTLAPDKPRGGSPRKHDARVQRTMSEPCPDRRLVKRNDVRVTPSQWNSP